MKKIMLITLFNLLVAVSFGQTKTDSIVPAKNANPNYFGLNFGTTTGVGLSYIIWPGKDGFQVTFLPLFDKKTQKFSLGFTYLRELGRYSESTKFFLYVGNHITNFINEDVIINLGAGPGIEVEEKNVVVHFMVGYGVYSIPNNVMTRPAAELGFFYRF